MRKIIWLAFGILMFVTGCKENEVSPAENLAPGGEYSLCESLPEERSVKSGHGKGIELYSFQNEDDEWVFSVLIGTNRVKTLEEITGEALSLEELEICLCKLPIGEVVIWEESSMGASGDEVVYYYPTPPDSIVLQVENLAIICEIDLWNGFD